MKRLVTIGTAIVMLLGVFASTASASPKSTVTAAVSTYKLAPHPDGSCGGEPCFYVQSVGNQYETQGAWHDCTRVHPTTYRFDWSCAVTYTGGNTVSGTVGVSIDVLSASVGYAINRSFSVTAGGNTNEIPDNIYGWIQWTTIYGTNRVNQVAYNNTFSELAFTHQWLGWTVRFELTKGTELASAPEFHTHNKINKCVANCG